MGGGQAGVHSSSCSRYPFPLGYMEASGPYINVTTGKLLCCSLKIGVSKELRQLLVATETRHRFWYSTVVGTANQKISFDNR